MAKFAVDFRWLYRRTWINISGAFARKWHKAALKAADRFASPAVHFVDETSGHWFIQRFEMAGRRLAGLPPTPSRASLKH